VGFHLSCQKSLQYCTDNLKSTTWLLFNVTTRQTVRNSFACFELEGSFPYLQKPRHYSVTQTCFSRPFLAEFQIHFNIVRTLIWVPLITIVPWHSLSISVHSSNYLYSPSCFSTANTILLLSSSSIGTTARRGHYSPLRAVVPSAGCSALCVRTEVCNSLRSGM